MNLRRKNYGYTLLEILVVTGVSSVAALLLYALFNIADGWRKSNTEVQSLTTVMNQIDNSTITTGVYSGIDLVTLNKYSDNFNSVLNLNEVVSDNPQKLKFVYQDVSPMICNNLTGKMLSSSKKVGAIINKKTITQGDLVAIAEACDGNNGLNEVILVLNKLNDGYTIDNVVASVNPGSIPQPEMVLPNTPVPQFFPGVNAFVPGTVTVITTPLTNGSAPINPPISIEGGPIMVTPGTSGAVVTPPSWTPPVVIKPPSTPAAPDVIDQDPDPPPVITTETRNGSCPSGYTGSTVERRTKTYYPGTGRTTYSSWMEVSRNCIIIPPPYISITSYSAVTSNCTMVITLSGSYDYYYLEVSDTNSWQAIIYSGSGSSGTFVLPYSLFSATRYYVYATPYNAGGAGPRVGIFVSGAGGGLAQWGC